MNSKKEYICIAGIVIFIAITSFKFGNDYSVYGLKKIIGLTYNNNILYALSKDGYVSMLDKYGHILELEFLNFKEPTSILAYKNKNELVVSADNELIFYQLPSKFVKTIKFSANIKQIARLGKSVLVLLKNGNCLKVDNHEVSLLFNIDGATSIASSNTEIFVAFGNCIVSYNLNKQVLAKTCFGKPINYINFDDGYLSVTSTSSNKVFLLNKNLDVVKSLTFDKPTFAYYSKQKLFVSSSDLDKIYIKNN